MTITKLARKIVSSAASSTNPNHRGQREFNLLRDHTVGQFLNAHPDAKRVLLANRAEGIKTGMFSLQMRARMA